MFASTIKTAGKLGKGPIRVGESETWPEMDVLVSQYYYQTLEVGADEAAVEKYMRQLNRGRYAPISVSSRYSDTDCLDGSHRVIAAHRLGLKTIRAHVEPGSTLHV